jgi:hypothetical protein
MDRVEANARNVGGKIRGGVTGDAARSIARPVVRRTPMGKL